MFIDPIIVDWAILLGASFAAFMVGKTLSDIRKDDVIENTILFLVENKLVKWKHDENGEIELLPIDDK